jgi:hypothetical protein
VDNGAFDPHGFGVGAAAALAVGLGAVLVAASNNVADVMADEYDAAASRRVDEGMRNLVAINETLAAALTKERGANASLMAQFMSVARVAQQQQEQLDRLRAGS